MILEGVFEVLLHLERLLDAGDDADDETIRGGDLLDGLPEQLRAFVPLVRHHLLQSLLQEERQPSVRELRRRELRRRPVRRRRALLLIQLR